MLRKKVTDFRVRANALVNNPYNPGEGRAKKEKTPQKENKDPLETPFSTPTKKSDRQRSLIKLVQQGVNADFLPATELNEVLLPGANSNLDIGRANRLLIKECMVVMPESSPDSLLLTPSPHGSPFPYMENFFVALGLFHPLVD